FLHPYSPDPVRDYFPPPNHLLPTNPTPPFSTPLPLTHFQNKTTIISFLLIHLISKNISNRSFTINLTPTYSSKISQIKSPSFPFNHLFPPTS
ncbi:histidinol dehydrogenase, partial [Bacillus pumilus]|uniref:histidinol dehydrogenase n=1 Tax=Bacillus pumilus TaxID=1408 RepID=UPI001642977C